MLTGARPRILPYRGSRYLNLQKTQNTTLPRERTLLDTSNDDFGIPVDLTLFGFYPEQPASEAHVEVPTESYRNTSTEVPQIETHTEGRVGQYRKLSASSSKHSCRPFSR